MSGVSFGVPPRWCAGFAAVGMAWAVVQLHRQVPEQVESGWDVAAWVSWHVLVAGQAFLVVVFALDRDRAWVRKTWVRVAAATAAAAQLGPLLVGTLHKWWFGSPRGQSATPSEMGWSLTHAVAFAGLSLMLWWCIGLWRGLHPAEVGLLPRGERVPVLLGDAWAAAVMRRAPRRLRRALRPRTYLVRAAPLVGWLYVVGVVAPTLIMLLFPVGEFPRGAGWWNWVVDLVGTLLAGAQEEPLFVAVPVLLFVAGRTSGRPVPVVKTYGLGLVVALIGISGLLRGLMHTYYGNPSNPPQHLPFIPDLAVGGAVSLLWGAAWGGFMVWLFLRYGRLLPLIVAHGCKNLLGTVQDTPIPDLSELVGLALIDAVVLFFVWKNVIGPKLRKHRQKKAAGGHGTSEERSQIDRVPV